VDHKKQIEGYPTTRAVFSVPVEKPIPKELIKKLVKASLKSMKEKDG
jgi:uncharacterized protein YdhG (YjbR/CyaY superfamily)